MQDEEFKIVKEAGPEISVQSHTLIVPSRSLELLPSSETLSVGKVITWSGPALAMGDLLPSLQPSQEISFWQERKNNIPVSRIKGAIFNSSFMIEE